ncbi:MAG: UbiA family prenyltransferase [Chitinophagales bacterium]|nr:UbiA family prenyltransferase [Chitinophagales bacterium]
MSIYAGISQKLTSIVQRFIFSNIYISLGALCFAIVNTILLDIHTTEIIPIYIIIFCCTLFIYQFSRWIFFRNLTQTLSKDKLYYWMESHGQIIVPSMIISIVVCMILSFWISKAALEHLFLLGCISFLYNIKVPIGNKSYFTLREIPFAKIFQIALVWATMAVILPWVEVHGWNFNIDVISLFAIQFLFIFIITLPFDINDVEVDKETGVKTIPIVIGKRKSKVLLSVLSLAYLLALYVWMDKNSDLHSQNFLFFIGISILIFSLLYKTILRSGRVEKWKIMLWYDGSLILYFLIWSLSQLYTFV